MAKLLSPVAPVCFVLAVLVFVCWMNLVSYITAGNLIKTKYLCTYYEILIYWVFLAHYSFTLPLIRQCFSLFLLFFLFSFLLFFKPKLFYLYLFESLRKQQLRGILLNIYVFNLKNFTKLCSLLATFVNTQETFQCNLNVVVRLI